MSGQTTIRVVTITARDVAEAWARWQDAERKWEPGSIYRDYTRDAYGRYTQLLDLYDGPDHSGDLAAVQRIQDELVDKWPLSFPVYIPPEQLNPPWKRRHRWWRR